MGIGGLLSFVGLAIELLIAGSQAADGACFHVSASGSKKQIPIILSWGIFEKEALLMMLMFVMVILGLLAALIVPALFR
jgi:hypothetical protein